MCISILLSIMTAIPLPVQNVHRDGKVDAIVSAFQARGPHSFDVLHYELSIELFEDILEFDGNVGIHFQCMENGLSDIDLDLLSLTVSNVWDSQGTLSFSQNDSIVNVVLSSSLSAGDTCTVWLDFNGSPSNNGFAGFFGHYTLVPHAFYCTVGMEPMSGRWVFPCWDDIYDKASIDAHITVNDTLFAVSCGELTDVEHGSGVDTYHWNHPDDISLYIWAMAVSDFIVMEDSTYNWIKYYAFPEYSQYVEQLFGKVDLMMDCFTDVYGTYPWGENLGFPFVSVPCYCEHNTIPYTLAYENTVAHEISHHWWGNLVTEEDWSEIWLAESFATYSEAVWEEWEYGSGAYSDYVLETMQWYLQSGELFPIVPAEDYWCSTTYEKGASVLHMLRYVIGDDAFFTGMQNYLTNNSYCSTTTPDLITEFEATYGSDLDWFFDTWVYDWAYPIYEHSWDSQQSGSEWDVDITIDQVQTIGPVFEMPVELLIKGASRDTVVVMWNYMQNQTETYTIDFQPLGVQLDPDNNILHAGLLEIEEEPDFQSCYPVSVFPNPTSSIIAVGWPHHGHFTARLFDISGRCILKSEMTPASPYMDVSSFPSGSYSIVAESGNETATGSLTIIHLE